MTQPQPGGQPQPAAGTAQATKPRRSRSRAPEWMSKPPVMLTAVGCVVVLELSAFFGLGLLWWAVANVALVLVVWSAMLAWRRKGKGGWFGQLLDRLFGGRAGAAGGSGGGKSGKNQGRGGPLSRLFGGGPSGGKGSGKGPLGKLLGGRPGKGGKSGFGMPGKGRGGPLGKLLGGRGGGKGSGGAGGGKDGLGKLLGGKTPGSGKSAKLGTGGKTGSWWPFTNPFGGSSSRRSRGGGSGGGGSRKGKSGGKGGKTGKGGKNRRNGKGGWLSDRDRDDLDRILNDDFGDLFGRREKDNAGGDEDTSDGNERKGLLGQARDEWRRGDEAATKVVDRITGANRAGTGDDTRSENETIVAFGMDGGTMARGGRIYNPGISLQGFAAKTFPAIAGALEADIAANKKVTALREEYSREIERAATQADTEMPMNKKVVAELQVIATATKRIAAETAAATTRLRNLHAQAETLRATYLRGNEHDEARATGGRGHGHNAEQAADVSRAKSDM